MTIEALRPMFLKPNGNDVITTVMVSNRIVLDSLETVAVWQKKAMLVRCS